MTDTLPTLAVRYDPVRDELVIEGMRYSGEFFRGLGGAFPTGERLQIISREHGTVAFQRLESTPGVDRIAGERTRQIRVEGWTLEHDRCHAGDELAMAAAWYATPVDLRSGAAWPWPDCWRKPGNGSPSGRIRELEKAGALIAAEIDRLLDIEAARALKASQ